MYIEDLLGHLNNYSFKDKELILRAFEFASVVHKGVKRKSGEDYIIHPIAVACILAEMHADADTIAAGLLHDTIEDGDNITYETIEKTFNPTIAYLVDGVTKVLNRQNKTDEEENKRKIAESILKDVRILIIKLADRLHNMRTLEYQTEEKQVKKSIETLNLYTPLARLIGEYTFKLELEDLAFKYMDIDDYLDTEELLKQEYVFSRPDLDETLISVSQILNSNNIPFDIKLKVKNLYSLFKKINKHDSIKDVHDLFELKIMVKNIESCYVVKDLLSKVYKFREDKSKDYIYLPKTNMYQSIHESTVFKDRTNIQFQIKTPEMYMINAYGITAYWNKYQKMQNVKMQDDLRMLPFYQTLEEISRMDLSTQEFNQQFQRNVLDDKVYVSLNGVVVEIPCYYNLLNLLKKFNYDIRNYDVYVNGQIMDLSTNLKNKDVVKIKTK